MWNSNKSVMLSFISTKIVMVLAVIFMALTPRMLEVYTADYGAVIRNSYPLIVILELCGVLALIALFHLHSLLGKIRQDEVFIPQNVRSLRIISWSCFGASIFLLVGGFYYFLFFAMSIISAFMALILRVVKNVIEQAVLIKAENDYTI